MQKTLTVSIAAYNMENYIRETLDSITGTSYIDDVEVFVIDDGGTDATMRIAGEYQRLFPQSVFLIHKDNGGWGSTVNYSIEHATGKYIKLLDGDDCFDDTVFDSYIELLRKCDSDAVCTPYRMFYDNDQLHQRYISIDRRVECGREYQMKDVTEKIILSMHALTFKTEVLRQNKIRLMEYCFYTDTEYIAKALRVCNTVKFFDIPLYRYRIAHADRSCGILGYNRHYKEHEQVYNELVDFRKTLLLNKESSPIVNRIVYMMVGKQYRVYLLLDSRKQSKELFWSFDKNLKQNDKELYNNASMGRILRVCKKIPVVGYDLARLYYRSIKK